MVGVYYVYRDSSLPGYLTVVADEVRNYAAGGATTAEIAAKVAALPHKVHELMAGVLERLSVEHGSGPVALLFCTLLHVARATAGGCSEEELQVQQRLVQTWECVCCVRVCRHVRACILCGHRCKRDTAVRI